MSEQRKENPSHEIQPVRILHLLPCCIRDWIRTDVEFIKQGQGELARGAALAGLIAHNSEMYGISTVYLRAKNIVPPSTEQQVLRQGGQKQK